MPAALAKFGLAQRVTDFKDAEAGDIISFDRKLGNRSAHSVVFLSFINKEQQEVTASNENTVVGFKYFSSQSPKWNKYPGGLGVRWAYFYGKMCPFADVQSENSCEDLSASADDNMHPVQKEGKPRDCCVIGPEGLHIGRVLAPPYWSFKKAHASLIRQYASLKTHVTEFLQNRENLTIQTEPEKNGAITLEAPQTVAPVHTKFDGKSTD